MTYDFNIKLRDEPSKWEVLVDTKAAYGCFEHDIVGEGGGLWFERHGTQLVLIDYDGRAVLPKGVARALRSHPMFVVAADFT